MVLQNAPVPIKSFAKDKKDKQHEPYSNNPTKCTAIDNQNFIRQNVQRFLLKRTDMTTRKYILFFFVAVLHNFLFLIIPDYFIPIYPVMLMLWVLIFISVIVIDLFGKTQLWKGAFYGWGSVL